jgi:hypothetical protein
MRAASEYGPSSIKTSSEKCGYLFEEAWGPLARGVVPLRRGMGTSGKRSRYLFEEAWGPLARGVGTSSKRHGDLWQEESVSLRRGMGTSCKRCGYLFEEAWDLLQEVWVPLRRGIRTLLR